MWFHQIFTYPYPVSLKLVSRDSTSYQNVSARIGSALVSFALLLLLAVLAYVLWRVRQGRVHTERISLVHLVPRRRTAQQPVRLIDTRMGRRVSTQAYSPEIALPWSLFRNYHPSPAPTAPTPATPPRSVVSCFGFESPTVPERAHVTNPHLLQEPYRSVAPSLNLNTYSDSGSPIIIPRTPPPAWQCLSPRPPTYGSYDSSDEDALMSSSSGHRFGL